MTGSTFLRIKRRKLKLTWQCMENVLKVWRSVLGTPWRKMMISLILIINRSWSPKKGWSSTVKNWNSLICRLDEEVGSLLCCSQMLKLGRVGDYWTWKTLPIVILFFLDITTTITTKDLPKICRLIIFQILVCTWRHWVSRGQYLLVLGGTGSVLGYVKVHRILDDFQNWIRSGRVPKKMLASGRITGTYGAMIVALLQWWTE